MPKFLVLQRRLSTAARPLEAPTPDQIQAMISGFNAWSGKFQDNLLDRGGKLGAGRLTLPRPVPVGVGEVRESVGGYMVVSALDLEDATRIAGECPGLVGPGSGIEVIEVHTPG